jgi:hypothetical protein
MAGAFRVYQDPNNARDIFFELQVADVPREQLELRDRVAGALSVLRIIVTDKDRFAEYFRSLLSLAQAGLVGATANPDLSLRALEELKLDVTAREAGRIKNQYMKNLGMWALLVFAILLAARIAVHRCLWGNGFIENLLVFEMGTMAGVWLSFGTRKPILSFDSLHILEEDRLEPIVRLLFTGLLAMIMALAFHLKVVTVTLGDLTTNQLSSDPWVAGFLGLLSGVGEKALSTKVTKQAAALLSS